MTECGAALVAAEAFVLVVDAEQVPAVLVAAGGQGPSGASSASYQHSQPSASALWVINHNLGYRPSVSAFSLGSQLMLANIIHTSINQSRIEFDDPVAGFATCS